MENIIKTKVAVFSGVNKNVILEVKEFSGDVMEQYFQVFDFIQSIFSSRDNSKFNIPNLVIMEALVNSFVHRDYKINSNNIISIFDDRLEIMSIGGIPEPLTLPDILNGASLYRNPELAERFIEKKLMTGLGTGISRINEEYSDSADIAKPRIIASPYSFLIIISNSKLQDSLIQEKSADPKRDVGYLTNEEIVYNYIKTHKSSTRKELENLLGVSSFPALQALNSLIEQNKIRTIGNARSTKYIVNDN